MMSKRTSESRESKMAAINTVLAVGIIVAMTCQVVNAQFTSGSDGSDGALDYTGQSGTIIFNPDDFVPPLDPDRDNAYHFTTITIPENLTLILRAPELNWAPVFWLATGLVSIEGDIDLSGGVGHTDLGPVAPSIPGPGGYPGGIGSFMGAPAQDGFGPGAGHVTGSGTCATHGKTCAGNLVTYGNIFLQPLIGGSGGSGLSTRDGGGAGGGAILIASSEEIRFQSGGRIRARGGYGGGSNSTPTQNAGSGGAIRLVAPAVGGVGSLDVGAGSFGAGAGYIRIETTQYTELSIGFSQYIPWRVAALTENTPLLTNQNTPFIRVVSVDGISIPNSPTADFVSPDVVIDNDQPVVFEIEAVNVAPGATVDVYIYPNDFPLIVTTSTPLIGTLGFSTATATATVPPGLCVSTVRAILNP